MNLIGFALGWYKKFTSCHQQQKIHCMHNILSPLITQKCPQPKTKHFVVILKNEKNLIKLSLTYFLFLLQAHVDFDILSLNPHLPI